MTVALRAIGDNGSNLGKVNTFSLIISFEMSSLPRVHFSLSFFAFIKSTHSRNVSSEQENEPQSVISPVISDYDSSTLDAANRPPLIPFGVYGDPGGVPLPTLYNGGAGGGVGVAQGGGLSSSAGGPFGPPMTSGGMGGGAGGGRRMGAIEFLLYNMASMLAGVAAGYDVRLSNVSPMHPRLHPSRSAHTVETGYEIAFCPRGEILITLCRQFTLY